MGKNHRQQPALEDKISGCQEPGFWFSGHRFIWCDTSSHLWRTRSPKGCRQSSQTSWKYVRSGKRQYHYRASSPRICTNGKWCEAFRTSFNKKRRSRRLVHDPWRHPDTLTGGIYGGTATGSSSKTPMMKFFSRLGGMRVEFICHTNRSDLNYIYQRDVAHDEYGIKRIFDTGVTEFLFPSDIYHLDMNKIRDSQISRVRKQIEEY